MSTNSEIELERIENGKSSLINSIENKGVSVPEGATIDELSLYVDDIPTPTAAGEALGLVKSGGDVTIADGVITVNDDSHNHVIANVDGLQAALNAKLAKTTYEESKELALGSNGKVCLGKFGAYDTNITIEINSTTHTTYHATIVISTQNVVSNGTGGTVGCYVYDDADNHITPLISVFRPYGSASRQIEVYADLPGWSKNLVHVQGVGISDGGMTDVLTSVETIPTAIDGKIKVTPVNVLTTNFASKTEVENNLTAAKKYADEKAASIVGSAPETLNALNELASALGNDPNFATTVSNQLGNKADQSDYDQLYDTVGDINTELGKKADASALHKVATSGSYNDLTNKPTIPAAVTVDSAMSSTSTNPVQNKIITATLAGKTSTSVLPNNSGEIKTKYRVSQKGDAGRTEGSYWYYKLCDLPTNDSGNYASAIISGRIGGWTSNDMSYINALVWNRGVPGIALIDIAGAATAMSTIWNTCELVLYANSANTATLYAKCYSWFTFDLDIEVFQSSASITYDGTFITTTPTGTFADSCSKSTKRLELVAGGLYVNGQLVPNSVDIEGINQSLDLIAENTLDIYTQLGNKADQSDYDQLYDTVGDINTALDNKADASAIPTKTSQLTNNSGFATETYVNNKVAGIVDSSPETLNTLNELAAALGDDPNFATTVSTELGKKANTTDVNNALAKKMSIVTTNGNYLNTKTYISTHPENGGASIIPFLYNDIAHLLARGGACSIYTTNATSYTAVDLAKVTAVAAEGQLFDASPSYQNNFSSALAGGNETLIIDITCHKTFYWTSTIYIDFGAAQWIPSNVKILTSVGGGTYTERMSVTGLTTSLYKTVDYSSAGFNRIRFVLEKANPSLRIAQIGVINYGSAGVTETFVSRGGSSLFGSLIPYNNYGANLGGLNNQWNSIYGGTIYEGGTALSSKYAKDADLKAVAKSGSYNDLSNKPTIPSIAGLMPLSGGTITGKTTVDTTSNTDMTNPAVNILHTGPADGGAYADLMILSGFKQAPYGFKFRTYGDGTAIIQSQRINSNSEWFNLSLNPNGGKVLINGSYAVNEARLQEVLGSYVNDIDALLGG